MLIRTLTLLGLVDPGFDPHNLLTFHLALPQAKYGDAAARQRFFQDLQARIRALPGVDAATADSFLPFTGIGSATSFTVVGRPAPPPGQDYVTSVSVVLPDYFRTMRIPLLRGREFSPAEEGQERHVVIVNQALARQYFPGQDPLGQQIVIDMKDQNLPSTIVGVVGDVHLHGLDRVTRASVYWPYPELAYAAMTFAVRARGNPLGLIGAIRAQVASLDPGEPVAAVLAGRVEARDRTVVAVLSGGNIDEPVLAAALSAMSLRDAVAKVASETGLPRGRVYARALALAEPGAEGSAEGRGKRAKGRAKGRPGGPRGRHGPPPRGGAAVPAGAPQREGGGPRARGGCAPPTPSLARPRPRARAW